MTSSRVVDHDLDRPQVQAQRCVEPSGTNTACGLACFNFTSQKVRFGRLEPSRTLQVSLVPDLRPFQAGGHREAVIPVPIPNTEVKRLIAEGSAGPARARVGRRRPFLFCSCKTKKVPRLLALDPRQSFRPFLFKVQSRTGGGARFAPCVAPGAQRDSETRFEEILQVM